MNSVALTFPPGNLLLNAIASAVIGGVSLFGGRGEVRGALLGAVLIGTLQNGLNTLNVSNGWIYIITGLVLLGAVTLDTFAAAPAGPLRPLARSRAATAIDRACGRPDRPRASRCRSSAALRARAPGRERATRECGQHSVRRERERALLRDPAR